MTYDEKHAVGLRDLEDARQFQELFPATEHFIVQSKHDVDQAGWQLVDEWISRARLYDRYALWLVLPIEFTPAGKALPLEPPAVYFIEVEKVEKGRDEIDGPKWECNLGEFEAGDWDALVAARGDFAAMGAELITDAPVERFDIFWGDSCPRPEDPPPDEQGLSAPLRFIT